MSEIDKKKFSLLLAELKEVTNDFNKLDEISRKLSTCKSTLDRMLLLKETIVSEPISWEENYKNVWASEAEANKNKFPFIQADLIKTSSVLIPGKARSDNNLENWIVLTSTCDIVRNDGRQIRVAPAYHVMKSYKSSNDPEERELYRLLNLASSLKLKRGFPYPNNGTDDDDCLGYYCSIDEVAVLEEENIKFVSQVNSLTIEGWYLFCAIVTRFETKANIEEEIKLRKNI